MLNEIVQEMDIGFNCYYNPKTIVVLPVSGRKLMDEGGHNFFEEICGDRFIKMKANEKDFIKIKVLESSESFKIMENLKKKFPTIN